MARVSDGEGDASGCVAEPCFGKGDACLVEILIQAGGEGQGVCFIWLQRRSISIETTDDAYEEGLDFIVSLYLQQAETAPALYTAVSSGRRGRKVHGLACGSESHQPLISMLWSHSLADTRDIPPYSRLSSHMYLYQDVCPYC
jgi:hypothetical protein